MTKTVSRRLQNVKLDLVDPAGAPVATPTPPIDGAAADETLHGTGGNTINGLAGNDRIYGKAGSDRLHGGTGNDKLYGDAGNDRLYGDSGKDILNGGSGNDVLTGNDTDTFHFSNRKWGRTRSSTPRMATTSICAAMV